MIIHISITYDLQKLLDIHSCISNVLSYRSVKIVPSSTIVDEDMAFSNTFVFTV